MREKIKNLLVLALKEKYPEINFNEIDFSLETNTDTKRGDYSTNLCFVLASKLSKQPLEIAERLIIRFPKNSIIENVEFTPPGFLNFYLTKTGLLESLQEILGKREKYGSSDLGKDTKVLIDFISANPTGPLHLGNGRGGFLGDVLGNILEFYGCKVDKEYYINDVGNQIDDLGKSVIAARDKKGDQIYKGEYINEIAQKIKDQDIAAAGEKAAQYIFEKIIKKIIVKMGIGFDYFFSEKSLIDNQTVNHVLGILEKNKLTYKKDGAIWFKTSQFIGDKDDVLAKKDGNYTYFATDIAYHLKKIERGYNFLINLWGADHAWHAKRIKTVVEDVLKPEKKWAGELEILIFQLVRLISGGEELKMSKRSGTYITLNELIDEVGLDAARFFFLMYSPDTHMDFDLDLAKKKSQENPVFYVQYAYTRASNILKKATKKKITKIDFNYPMSKIEREMIKILIAFPDIISEIARDYTVHKLPHYALALAKKWHEFYEKERVLDGNKNEIEFRLSLVMAIKIVLKNCLILMGISAPEKM